MIEKGSDAEPCPASQGADEGATQTQGGASPTAGIPKRIGHYRIKRAIASGGMGTVYEAVQEKPRRAVAVKLMRAGIASRSALRRFEYESQLLARLRHPAIAQVYDAGTHRDGEVTVPYFAMEYIVGAKPVTEYANEKKLGIRERMRLFANVCEAVHHGHQKGIIHRDLKPSNILVDSSGQVKIIDFGVARSTDSDMAVTTLQTDMGQLIGTLQYMSPEQCAADPHDIDTRSDVYALGVVFYELLCGRLPYEIKGTAIHEATRVIREQEPTRLNTLNKRIRGDVETIALKALEKDRDRRYQSASALTADIKRYLNNEAISARPPSVAYQLRVFARRNKGLFSAAAAVFVVLVAGVVVSTMHYYKADAERRRADEERLTARVSEARAIRERDFTNQALEEAQEARAEAEAVTKFLTGMLARANPLGEVENVTVLTVLDQASETLGTKFKSKPRIEARLRDTIANAYWAMGRFEDAERHIRALQAQGADVANPLVDLLLLQGKFDEAELICRQRIAKSDDQDPAARFYASLQLGAVLYKQGDYSEAITHFADVVALADRTENLLAGDPLSAPFAMFARALVLFEREGRFAEAEAVAREVIPSMQTALAGVGITILDFYVLEAEGLLAYTMMAQGKYSQSRKYFRRTLDTQRRLLTEGHPNLAFTLNGLAGSYIGDGDHSHAPVLLEEAIQIIRASLGRGHIAAALSESLLGECLAESGEFQEAEPLLVRSFGRIKAHNWTPPTARRQRANALRRLVGLYDAWDAAEPDKRYAEKAAEWRAKLPEENGE